MIYCFNNNRILGEDFALVALLLLSYRCIVTINVLWLFLMVPWAGQCVIVAFHDHTHLLFVSNQLAESTVKKGLL